MHAGLVSFWTFKKMVAIWVNNAAAMARLRTRQKRDAKFAFQSDVKKIGRKAKCTKGGGDIAKSVGSERGAEGVFAKERSIGE